MRYLDLDGLSVSRVGLGTWQFGAREWGYGAAYADDVAPALIRRAVDLGVTLLDTAEAYAFGGSERIIGRTLADLGPAERDAVTVATKFLPIAPVEPILAWQAAGSRRRLETDAIDLYYAHWPNPLVSPRRTMQSLRPLVDAGTVRHVGVSNYDLGQWREAERALGRRVLANQVRFNLLSPGPARDLVPYAERSGRAVVAYSPLGQGLLAGQRGDGEERPPGMRGFDRRFGPGGRERLGPVAEAVHEVAAAHGATPAQVALAWVLAHPNTVVIPGARTVEQLEENARASDLELSDDEVARLTRAAFSLAGEIGA
jgi:aryl-alcohol dehydrogenase-like predicted oxidoreductase